MKSDWDSCKARSLADEAIVRLVLDRTATAVSLLVVLGVRPDGQKVLLAIESIGGQSAEA